MSKHIPVLLERLLEKVKIRPGGVYVDATFGEGHYTRALLDLGARVIATDVDPNAHARSKSISSPNFRFHLSRFGDMETVVKEQVDGVIFDIGVSSNQLEYFISLFFNTSEDRGFSFNDSTLDMRMSSLSSKLPVLTVLNTYPEERIAHIIYRFGEEHRSRKIAREICAFREKRVITSAKDLSGIVGGCLGWKGRNPATKTFQGLRIYVNDELGELYRGLCAAERLVKPDGFIAVVSFHSLEDRLVKTFFRFCQGKRIDMVEEYPQFTHSISDSIGPFQALSEELKNNIRSRSGKLRIAYRNTAPPNGDKLSGLDLWERDASRNMRQMMRGSANRD